MLLLLSTCGGTGNQKAEGEHTFDEFALSDIGLFLEKVATIFPGIPVVLYGQSLGVNLAVNYVIERLV